MLKLLFILFAKLEGWERIGNQSPRKVNVMPNVTESQ